MRYFLSLLFFVFPVIAYDITVNGTGIVGIWTAYFLSTELEKAGVGDQVTLHVVGKWDWQKGLQEAAAQGISVFYHETSGWGPVGMQLQTGTPWNLNDDKVRMFKENIGKIGAGYYISPDLDEEGKRVIEMYAGWHGRHLDTEEQRLSALLEVNRISSKLWLDFQDSLSEYDKKWLSLSFEGCWSLRSEELSVKNEVQEYQERNSLALGCLDTDLLAKTLPFYASDIIEKQLKGVFFSGEAMVDSNKLREWLWSALLEKRGGKPKVVLHQGVGVEKLLIAEDGSCKGVIFEDGSTLASDLTVLSTGYGTKALLKREGIDLPLYKLWGAAIKAELKEKVDNLFPGPIGTGPGSLYVVMTEGKKIACGAPFSFFLPEETTPAPTLFKERLNKLFFAIFKDRVDPATIHYYLAARTLLPDELPVIDLEKAIPNLVILLPTHHMGLAQSIALGKIASLHAVNRLGKTVELPFSVQPFRADRFKGETVIKQIFD